MPTTATIQWHLNTSDESHHHHSRLSSLHHLSNQRVTSAPVWCVRDTEYLSASASVVSSLFDEDEDEEEMEEIPVQ